MIRERLAGAARAVGRAALAGLATENGWCWVWGFGPAPRHLHLDHRHDGPSAADRDRPQRGALRAASAEPAAARATRSSTGSRASTSPARPTS